MNAGRALSLVGAAAMLAPAAVASAGTDDPTATQIAAFSWTDADGDTDYFDGRISSTEKKCEKNRKVKLYRKQSGPDARIGKATTDPGGRFTIEREDPGSGRYYLKVKKAEAGALTCTRAQAGPLSVTDLEGV